MKTHEWFTNELCAGRIVVRIGQDRHRLGAPPYTSADVRVYFGCDQGIGLVRHQVTTIQNGNRKRGPVELTRSHDGSSLGEQVEAALADWHRGWRNTHQGAYVVSGREYPAINPSALRHLDIMQGGLDMMVQLEHPEANLAAQVSARIAAYVNNGLTEIQRHTGCPR